MSDGRRHPQYPQKLAKTKRAPDYQRLVQPLPEPPPGLSWHYDSASKQKWILVSDSEAYACLEEDTSAILWNVASASTATPVAVVPLEMDQAVQNVTTLPEANVAEVASVASAAAGTYNEEGDDCPNEEGIALLPQTQLPEARMVNDVVPTATSVTPLANTNVSCDSKSGPSKDGDKDCDDIEYTTHVVLPTDTLAGLCLLYKISRRDLQRANRFYGDDLRLAPGQLTIPITEKARRLGWMPQDFDSREYKMAALLAKFSSLSSIEAKW